MEICKYLTKKETMTTIATCLNLLYSFDNCNCGGLGHVVFDDDNIQDEDLDSTIDWCNAEENQYRPEKDLVIFMCEQMKKLSVMERAFLFTLMYHDHTDGEYLCTDCIDDECNSCTYIRWVNEYFNNPELGRTPIKRL